MKTKKLMSYKTACWVLVTGLAVTLFSACQHHTNEEYTALENKNQELQTSLTQRDSVINDMIQTFDQIDSNLQVIKKQRQIVSLESNQVEMSKDKKSKIIADVQMMNKLLVESKNQIKSLNARIRESGIKISGLEKKLAELQQNINARGVEMDSLRDQLAQKDIQINQINQHVGDLEAQVTEQSGTIKQKQDVINTGYIASGTYQELRDKGIITKQGGFLGIGTSKTINSNIIAKNFKKIDITQTTTIPVNSSKAVLITEHPAGSYKFVEKDNKIAYLEIDNPSEFWKVSKYAVLEMK